MLDDARLVDTDIEQKSAFLEQLKGAIGEVIVGQEYMIERLLVGLLANGHVLLEGAPGLAKTLAVTTLAQTLTAEFQRIQFTPDLLPVDAGSSRSARGWLVDPDDSSSGPAGEPT